MWTEHEQSFYGICNTERFLFVNQRGHTAYKDFTITYYPYALFGQLFFTKVVKNQAPIDLRLPSNWIVA